jgi:hypothetical protein
VGYLAAKGVVVTTPSPEEERDEARDEARDETREELHEGAAAGLVVILRGILTRNDSFFSYFTSHKRWK